MKGCATIRLVGVLGSRGAARNSQENKIDQVLTNVPIKLGEVIRRIEEERGLELSRESILILVNGIEANALDDLETMIYENDQIVLLPMFHGGSFH
jgi:molybdopterin converting factor small subunit